MTSVQTRPDSDILSAEPMSIHVPCLGLHEDPETMTTWVCIACFGETGDVTKSDFRFSFLLTYHCRYLKNPQGFFTETNIHTCKDSWNPNNDLRGGMNKP